VNDEKVLKQLLKDSTSSSVDLPTPGLNPAGTNNTYIKPMGDDLSTPRNLANGVKNNGKRTVAEI
jgi:hypothetical protein